MRMFISIAAMMLAVLPQAAAEQQEEDLRWIDRAGASSSCIGSAGTAECAVETALACQLRRDAGLCATVQLALAEAGELPFSRDNPDPFEVVEATGVKYLIYDEEQGDSRRITVSLRVYGKHGLDWPERGWRRITYSVRRDGGAWRVDSIFWQQWIHRLDSRYATSRCIGDRETPVCAVETHMACRVRGEEALCDGMDGLEPKHFRPKGATVLYTIDRIRRWEPPELAPRGSLFAVVWVAESTEAPAPGGTQQGEAYVTRPGFVPVSYILERRDGLWTVLSRTERP